MRITQLQTINFKRLHGHRTYDFPDGIVGITGNNGRGKSTIASAIAWSLFGPEVLPTGKADVVTWGTDRAFVRTILELNGTQYNIERHQTKSGTSDAQVVLVPDDPIYPPQFIARGIDPVNREVEKILGVDRVGFLASVYARQEELSGLASLTPANRMKTVLRLMGIEQLTSAIDKVRANARDVRKELEGLRAGYQNPDEVAELLEKLLDEEDHVDQEIEEEQERLAILIKGKETLNAKVVQLIPQRQAYEQYRDKLSKATIAFRVAAAELRGEEREAEKPRPSPPGEEPERVDADDVSRAAGNVQATVREIDRLLKTIANLQSSSVCYACHRPFDHAEDIQTQIREINEQIDSLLFDKEQYESEHFVLSAALSDRKKWEHDNEKFQESQKLFDEVMQRLERARTTVAREHEYLRSIQPVEDPTEALEAVQREVSESENGAAQIRVSLATLAEQKKRIEQQRYTYTNFLEAANFLQGEIDKKEGTALNTEVTATELTRLKESMIAMAIPTLSDRASRLVNEFTDGRYTELHLTANYEIQYRNDLGELKSFDNLSGGEKDVFALALRLAISDLRADSIGILLLDEVMESLDVDRQQATWQAVERLTNRYNQVLLITHVQDFKDRASTVIEV